AYTDYPGSNLMNNLNLVVTDPSGKIYTGNQRAGGPAVLDARNNVEVVQENSAAAGNWTIRVVASSVTVGPQDFALVVLGNLV
ncbi:MAG: serine protease, partial [Planctomyces sp.]